MIIFTFVILAIFLIIGGTRGSNDDETFFGWFVLIGILIIYTCVIFGNYSMVAQLKSEYISLDAQYEYIEQLPNVPMKNNGLDTANFKLASQIIQQKINYWSNVKRYNAAILYWKNHPNMDLIIWGYPRISPIINKMSLIMPKGE